MSFIRFKQSTPIPFKKATVVVVALHVAGFTLLYGWSAYRSNRAKLERQLKMAAVAANYNPDKTFWNNHDKKLRVVAVSPVTKLNPFVKPKPTIQEQIVEKVSSFIIGTKKNMDAVTGISVTVFNDTKDMVNKIEKNIEQSKPVKPKPVAVKQPTPKPKKPQQTAAITKPTPTLRLSTSTPIPTPYPVQTYTKQTATKNGRTHTQYEQYEEVRRPVETAQIYYPPLPREVPMRVTPPPPSYPSAGLIPGESVRVYYQ